MNDLIVQRDPDDGEEYSSTMDIDWSLVDLSVGARVERGALYIEREVPGALSRIDWEAFGVGLGDCCIIGQVRGTWIGSPEWLMGQDFLVAHGFVPTARADSPSSRDDEYVLNGAWLAHARKIGALK